MASVPRVLHISTHHEPCGIGSFQEKCIEALNKSGKSINNFYALSLNKIKVLDDYNRKNELNNIVNIAKEYDLVHIQHEFGFFYKTGEGFGELIDVLKKFHIPVVVTIHTAPELLLVPGNLNSKTPRGLVGYYLRRRKNKRTIKNKFQPFAKADKVITFNNFTKNQLINIAGVNENKIFKTMLPVPSVQPKRNKKIRELLGANSEDVILCTSGFINPYKGFDNAVKALKYLPDNYKLAVLGGINPDSGNPGVYDNLCDLIISLGLEKRVYISGYIESDEELFELMQGCDVALYPYSPSYYRLASSDAINKAIGCQVPIIAFATESFMEINEIKSEVIMFTKSPNYYELVRSIKSVDGKKLIENEILYTDMYNYKQAAVDLSSIYESLLDIA